MEYDLDLDLDDLDRERDLDLDREDFPRDLDFPLERDRDLLRDSDFERDRNLARDRDLDRDRRDDDRDQLRLDSLCLRFSGVLSLRGLLFISGLFLKAISTGDVPLTTELELVLSSRFGSELGPGTDVDGP